MLSDHCSINLENNKKMVIRKFPYFCKVRNINKLLNNSMTNESITMETRNYFEPNDNKKTLVRGTMVKEVLREKFKYSNIRVRIREDSSNIDGI